MTWLFGTVLTFQLERPVFLREQANNMYSPVAYFIAKNMVETPPIFIAPLLQLLIMYFGFGYVHFGLVYLAMLITAMTAFGIGLLISAGAQNVNSATSIAPLFTMPFVLFGGFIANNEAIPSWLNWIQWISPIRYANEMMAHSQFDDLHAKIPPQKLDLP